MPVVQPVLGTVTNTYISISIYIYLSIYLYIYIYIYIYIYMIIVGKSMSIDNYEQCKRVINQITGRLYMHIYIYIYLFSFFNLVCVWLFITV